MLVGTKGYKIYLLFVLSFLVFPLNINAIQRVWPGIVNDTVIISDTTIIEHDPFILPPGTHIIFKKNSTLLATVPVKAIGTYDNPIIFSGGEEGRTSPAWESFSIECQNNDSVVFKCCEFYYANNPIIISHIKNVYIQDCYFFKFENICITCNNLSNNLVVENCYFLGRRGPIINIVEPDSGASGFIKKNFRANLLNYIIEDTVTNIYYTDNDCSRASGCGPRYSTWYFAGSLKVINMQNYPNNNLNIKPVSKSVSIDGRVLVRQPKSHLVVLNRNKKISLR